MLWLSIPSGFLVVFEKPNRSSCTFTFTCTFTRLHGQQPPFLLFCVSHLHCSTRSSDPSQHLDITQIEGDAPHDISVTFTYSIKWKPTDMKYEHRHELSAQVRGHAACLWSRAL